MVQVSPWVPAGVLPWPGAACAHASHAHGPSRHADAAAADGSAANGHAAFLWCDFIGRAATRVAAARCSVAVGAWIGDVTWCYAACAATALRRVAAECRVRCATLVVCVLAAVGAMLQGFLTRACRR